MLAYLTREDLSPKLADQQRKMLEIAPGLLEALIEVGQSSIFYSFPNIRKASDDMI